MQRHAYLSYDMFEWQQMWLWHLMKAHHYDYSPVVNYCPSLRLLSSINYCPSLLLSASVNRPLYHACQSFLFSAVHQTYGTNTDCWGRIIYKPVALSVTQPAVPKAISLLLLQSHCALTCSEGMSSLTSDVNTRDGSEQSSSWTRLRQQVMDVVQTVVQLPATAPVTDQVLRPCDR